MSLLPIQVRAIRKGDKYRQAVAGKLHTSTASAPGLEFVAVRAYNGKGIVEAASFLPTSELFTHMQASLIPKGLKRTQRNKAVK